MDSTHTPQRCRWAVPTLYLPLPNWLDAWEAPWTCYRDDVPRTLHTTEECLTCARWEARAEPQGISWAVAQMGL